MSKEKGLSLLEVLVAVTILSLVILSASYLFTKNYEFSFREEKRDASVNIARTVIEELKPVLPSINTDAVIFQQTISANQLALLKNNLVENSKITIFSPTAADKQYSITISDVPIPDNKRFNITDNSTPVKTMSFQVNQYFSLIEVTVTNNQFNSSYTIQSYIEKKE